MSVGIVPVRKLYAITKYEISIKFNRPLGRGPLKLFDLMFKYLKWMKAPIDSMPPEIWFKRSRKNCKFDNVEKSEGKVPESLLVDKSKTFMLDFM